MVARRASRAVSLEFVDTNVLLYAYDVADSDRHRPARSLVSRLGRARSGALSVQVLQEFYVNAVRKIAVPLSPAVARQRIAVLGLWPTHSPTAPDVLTAVDIAEQERISFWDAMIVTSAAALGCEVLWTEDLNDGQLINGVRVRNPFG